jgi:hypothetical protein
LFLDALGGWLLLESRIRLGIQMLSTSVSSLEYHRTVWRSTLGSDGATEMSSLSLHYIYNDDVGTNIPTSFETLWEMRQYVEAAMDDFPLTAGIHTVGPFAIQRSTMLEVIVGDGAAWAIRFLDVGADERTVVRFRSACPVSRIGRMDLKD